MNRHKLDATDLRILAEVQRDGRITKVALAERVGLSATPCTERVRRMERVGVITGYHARVDPRALGRPLLVFVELKLADGTIVALTGSVEQGTKRIGRSHSVIMPTDERFH